MTPVDRKILAAFAERYRLKLKDEGEGQWSLGEFVLTEPGGEESGDRWLAEAGVSVPATSVSPEDVDIVELGRFDRIEPALVAIAAAQAEQFLEAVGMGFDFEEDQALLARHRENDEARGAEAEGEF
jgi:hypothetical protein